MKNQKKNSGRTMIETLAVLAVIGMVIAMGAGLIGDAMQTYKINALNNQVFDVYQRTVASFKVDGNYGALGTTGTTGNKEALRRELVASAMKPKNSAAITANRITHAYRGSLEIFASGTNNMNFTIRLKNVNDAGCMGLLSAISSDIFLAARVGGAAVKSLNVSDIKDACMAPNLATDDIEIDFKTNYFFSK